MENKDKFKQFMATLGEVHDKVITPALMEIYWQILEQFNDAQCESAFKAAIVGLKFFPKPVDLLELLQGKQENRGTEAWLKVLGAIKTVGNYQSVKFNEPVIHSVIEAMGGWERLCMMEQEEQKWKQKEFERLYFVLSSHPSDHHPDYLPGTIELTNFRTGHEVTAGVIQIGFNEQKQIA